MELILIRHAERRHDLPEQSASLTTRGSEKASDTAAAIADDGHLVDLVVTSQKAPTIETGNKLKKKEADAPSHELELLNPGSLLNKFQKPADYPKLTKILE